MKSILFPDPAEWERWLVNEAVATYENMTLAQLIEATSDYDPNEIYIGGNIHVGVGVDESDEDFANRIESMTRREMEYRAAVKDTYAQILEAEEAEK